MPFLEIVTEFVVEVIFIDIVGGTISKVNNAILKFRGIETRTIDEIKLAKLKKRYEFKTVTVKSNNSERTRGKIGVVLELINRENALVEFENSDEIASIPINKLQLKR